MVSYIFTLRRLNICQKSPERQVGLEASMGVFLGRGNGRRAETQEGMGSWAWLEKGPVPGAGSTGELALEVSWGPYCCPWPSGAKPTSAPWAGAHVRGALRGSPGISVPLGSLLGTGGSWDLGQNPRAGPKPGPPSFSYSSGVGLGRSVKCHSWCDRRDSGEVGKLADPPRPCQTLPAIAPSPWFSGRPLGAPAGSSGLSGPQFSGH